MGGQRNVWGAEALVVLWRQYVVYVTTADMARVVLMRTRSFWLFAAAGFAELGALLLLGQTTMTPAAVVVIAVLVLWLGRGSHVAWWLFVAANSYALLGTLLIAISSSTNGSSGRTDWGNILVICVGSVVLLALLLSRPMRRPQSLSA